MKKKVVSIMMTAALAVGMLAGCGNSDSGSSNAASGNDSKSTSEAGSTSASASNAAEEEEITTTLTVWSPSEDQASDSGECGPADPVRHQKPGRAGAVRAEHPGAAGHLGGERRRVHRGRDRGGHCAEQIGRASCRERV